LIFACASTAFAQASSGLLLRLGARFGHETWGTNLRPPTPRLSCVRSRTGSLRHAHRGSMQVILVKLIIWRVSYEAGRRRGYLPGRGAEAVRGSPALDGRASATLTVDGQLAEVVNTRSWHRAALSAAFR
jgi:hypothetical protein